jgi:4-amino-4-deoxy-L-arabinose transferase
VNKKTFIILAALFAVLYIATLSFRPLYTPDEPRYAEIARELILHKDWVVPKLNNLCYFEKPIMGHWLNAMSMKVFGENAFAVRFSSAFLALLTALMLGAFVKRFASRRLAYMTATMYLTMGIVFGVGTYAVLDSPLNFFLTGTLITFFCACERKKNDFVKAAWLLAAGVFCGGAFLTKGFLAFGIPGMTILAYLFWQKDWKRVFTLPWLSLLTVILTVIPWVVLVHLRDGDFWNYFFWQEHVERFLGNTSSQHPEGWWFFIPWIFIGPMPWMLLLPQIVKGYGKRWKECFKIPLLRYSICWLVFPFLLCSASSGKLITYILPCFPAVAILMAFGLNEYIKKGCFKDIDKALYFFSWLFFGVVTLLAIAQILFNAGVVKYALYGEEETYKWIIVASVFLIWAFLARKASNSLDGYIKFGYFALATAIVMLAFHAVVPGLIEKGKAPVPQLSKFKNEVGKDTVLVSYKNLISSVCWTFKRDDVYLYHKAGELTYGLKREDTKHRLLSNEELRELVKKSPEDIVIIMDSNKRRKELPDYETGVWENGVFVKKYETAKK